MPSRSLGMLLPGCRNRSAPQPASSEGGDGSEGRPPRTVATISVLIKARKSSQPSAAVVPPANKKERLEEHARIKFLCQAGDAQPRLYGL